MDKRIDAGYIAIAIVLSAIGFITLYPILFVLSMSISDPAAAYTGKVFLWPVGFSMGAFRIALENSDVWRGYANTVFYTAAGTAINMVLTVMGAYVLAQPRLCLKRTLTLFTLFTMFFSGGMIPSYILVSRLGLYNTRWAMLLPGAVSTFNLLIAVNYFKTVPQEIYESARIDGANDCRILVRITLGLVKPILATLVLYYAIGHWNSYMNALLYLSKAELQPLQIYMMRILVMGDESLAAGMDAGSDRVMIVNQLKYASILITMLPIMLIYPFLQRYFVKGVMIGSVKG